MQIKSLLHKFNSELGSSAQGDETTPIFFIVIAEILGLSRSDYFQKKEQEISNSDLVKVEAVLNRLKTGEPLQYILGSTQFYGLNIKVNPSVLIPRPETEELVEWIIDTVKENNALTREIHHQQVIKPQLLDIGTGSGCIAIALKRNLPYFSVMALDISAESLSTADENAEINGAEVAFVQQNILEAIHPSLLRRYDVIVSNPPYVKIDEIPEMSENVLAYEPHQALFVSNENPLLFYNAIADFAMENLVSGGILFFEINEFLGEETIQLLRGKGFINNVLKKDMQGKNRMIRCTKAN